MSLTAQEMIRPNRDLLEPRASARAQFTRRLIELERRISEHQGTVRQLAKEHKHVRQQLMALDSSQPTT